MYHPIILYDGVCGLCNRLVQFILKHDCDDRFRYASLQSDFAREILQRNGRNTDALDTVHVVLNHGEPAEALLTRNDAVIAVLDELGGAWRLLGRIFAFFPGSVRDWQYNMVAKNRYRVFGKYDVCPVPDPKVRHKFLDQV